MGTYRNEINRTLYRILKDDPNVLLLGQSIRDPYGGAFKVTRGLTRKFDDQIIDMPIAEAATIGMATGLSLGGYHPVVEIMFSDFLTLSIDQIHNHINKIIDMYNLDIGITIRTASGAGRAYGSTHSQNLETLLLSLPNVSIYTPTLYSNFMDIYTTAIYSKGVNFIIEGKLLYDQKLRNIESLNNTKNLDVVCYGEYAHIVYDLAQKYSINPICLDRIKPIDLKIEHDNVLIIDPSFVDQSFASWITYNIRQTHSNIYSIGANTSTLPASPEKEEEMMLTKSKIEQKIIEILGVKEV